MSAFGNNHSRQSSNPAFWKRSGKTVPGSIKPVYGAQHPPLQERPPSEHGTPKKEMKTKQQDAFQHFEKTTSDAWDADDDDEDIAAMTTVQMSMQDVHSTALEVIHNHSRQMLASRLLVKNNQTADVDDSRLPRMESGDPLPAYRPGSVQNTPTHKANGPGVGVRLTTQGHWHVGRGINHLPVPDRENAKQDKFRYFFEAETIDLVELRGLCWSGIPRRYRPTAWKILSGYLPPAFDRRDLTLQRKQQEYFNFVDQYFDTRLQETHQDTFRQIHIDIPRMSPLIPLFQQQIVQEMFERMLYIWAIRHPASGYVQGINDLVTPFFVVFLTEYISSDTDVDSFELTLLSTAQRNTLEADSFWCFSKLLDGIQDNYTFAQPGIQNKVRELKELVGRIDGHLHHHLEKQNVEYLQFSFRWMNNLLMREMPLHCVIRLWDTYLSEEHGFAQFHLYVCAAFLTRFSSDLQREKDFQGLLLMLQNLPTHHWTNDEVGLLLAEAYKLKYMFADAPNHLGKK